MTNVINVNWCDVAFIVLIRNVYVIATVSKTVAREKRGEGLTFTNLAKVNFNLVQRVQGVLLMITVLVMLYLFVVFGVDRALNLTLI